MELEETAARLAPGLLRYCRGRLADPALAEEVAQDALTALVARWRRHGPPDSPEAFVFRIARRRAGRAAGRRRRLFSLDPQPHLPDPQPGPGERAQARAELARVRRALLRLSARDREALLLVAAGELSGGAAAEVLGVSLSALKMRLHRARRRLAEALGSDGASPADAQEVEHVV